MVSNKGVDKEGGGGGGGVGPTPSSSYQILLPIFRGEYLHMHLTNIPASRSYELVYGTV